MQRDRAGVHAPTHLPTAAAGAEDMPTCMARVLVQPSSEQDMARLLALAGQGLPPPATLTLALGLGSKQPHYSCTAPQGLQFWTGSGAGPQPQPPCHSGHIQALAVTCGKRAATHHTRTSLSKTTY